jgi:hypothetical protein
VTRTRKQAHSCLRTHRSNSIGLESKLNASLVPEVALIVIFRSEGIAKTSQQIVKLNGSNRDSRGERNIENSADDEVKRIVAGRFANASPASIIIEISIKIAVCSTEQGLCKWLEMQSPVFDYWFNVIQCCI